MIYFAFFMMVSLYYVLNGYAVLGTNDDWALWGMLQYKGIYGTLIMSYPMSFFISKLYDIFPAFPWYSTLLATIIGINFYLISCYIKRVDSYLQAILLLALSFLLISYFWFNVTITGLTALTMVTSIGLINKDLKLSLVVMFLAFLLRSDIMFIFVPFYIVSYLILRERLKPKKDELITLGAVIVLIAMALYVQRQDTFYMEWLTFNKARSAIVDLAILNVDKNYFTPIEKFCYQVGWFQDPQLLSTAKLTTTLPSLSEVFAHNIQKIDLMNFILHYKFRYWLWLLLGTTAIALLVGLKQKRVFFIVLLVAGIILLLITRDVERVTIPIIILWSYILFEILKQHKVVSTLFLALFLYFFYLYFIPQWTKIDDTRIEAFKHLQKEANGLIKKSKKVCDISINFPTNPINELNIVFMANYLFEEDKWIKIDKGGVLPTGWLVRNRFFYETHDLSDTHTERKYKTYHDFLVDDDTAFFGSKSLTRSGSFKFLLKTYDKRYLKDRPNCKHKTKLIATSKHFGISQVQVVCKKKRIIEK